LISSGGHPDSPDHGFDGVVLARGWVASFHDQIEKTAGPHQIAEEAVRWRVFDQTVSEVKAHNAAVPVEEIEAEIDEALAAARAPSAALDRACFEGSRRKNGRATAARTLH
jgi:hypothetical protein